MKGKLAKFQLNKAPQPTPRNGAADLWGRSANQRILGGDRGGDGVPSPANVL